MSKLTVDAYNDYRAQGFKDKEISDILKVSIGKINRFKNLSGLTNKSTGSNTKAKENIKSKSVVPKQVEPDWIEPEKAEKYFENKKTVVVDPEKLEMEYHIDQLKRDLQLHKDTASKAVQDLHLYTNDYEKLAEDFRISEFNRKNLAAEVEDLKETVQLNHLLMRQHVKFLNRLDTVREVEHA